MEGGYYVKRRKHGHAGMKGTSCRFYKEQRRRSQMNTKQDGLWRNSSVTS
jgi:hypothetical protein